MPRTPRQHFNSTTHSDRLPYDGNDGDIIVRKRLEYLLLLAHREMPTAAPIQQPPKVTEFDDNIRLLKMLEQSQPYFWHVIKHHAEFLRDMNFEYPNVGKIAFVIIGQRFFKGRREGDENYDYDAVGPRRWVTHVSEACVERVMSKPRKQPKPGGIGSELFYFEHLQNLMTGKAVEVAVASPSDEKPSLSFALPARIFTSIFVK